MEQQQQQQHNGEEPLVAAQTAPDLGIPESDAIVQVYVIDSTTYLDADNGKILQPKIAPNDRFHGPSYAFLIVNGKRRYLFDLGCRKDVQNLPPAVKGLIKKWPFEVHVKQDVSEILEQHASTTGVRPADIDGVIWSHHHWDHTGNMALFPPSVELVLGPGLRDAYYPGYPANPDATTSDSDLQGRIVREISFEGGPQTQDQDQDKKGLRIGGFAAVDFFGDGSFYLLSMPGHTVGHMCGLARTTADPPSFVFMLGDAAHNLGLIRPSAFRPLPRSIVPSPWKRHGCPGCTLAELQPRGRANEPFYKPMPGFNHDADSTERTNRAMEAFDAADNIFMILAHDHSLAAIIETFPATINGWRERGLAQKARWAWLDDFEPR